MNGLVFFSFQRNGGGGGGVAVALDLKGEGGGEEEEEKRGRNKRSDKHSGDPIGIEMRKAFWFGNVFHCENQGPGSSKLLLFVLFLQ